MGLFNKSPANILIDGINKEFVARLGLAKEKRDLNPEQEKLLIIVLTIAQVIGHARIDGLATLSDELARQLNPKVNPIAIYRFSCLIFISLLNRRKHNDSKYSKYNNISLDWLIQALSDVLELERDYFDHFLEEEIKKYPDDPTSAMLEQDFYIYNQLLGDGFDLQSYAEKTSLIIPLEMMAMNMRHTVIEGFDEQVKT